MPRFVAYVWVGRPERGVDLPPSGVVLHLYGPLPCGMPVWFVCRSLPLTSTNDFSDAGNTVPARGHDALPLGRRLFVEVRTDKEVLQRASPGCPLVPLDKLEREGGLDSRFSGKPVVFFCRSGSRTQNKAELLERSASGKAYQLGGGILAWEQAGFPVWSIRELLPCFAQEPAFISGVLA